MWLIGSCLCRGIFRNLENTNAEALVQRCSVKKVFWKISQNSQESTYSRISFLIKLQAGLTLQLYQKKALSQVFSCKFWEILKTFFLQSNSGGCFFQWWVIFTKSSTLNMWQGPNSLTWWNMCSQLLLLYSFLSTVTLCPWKSFESPFSTSVLI